MRIGLEWPPKQSQNQINILFAFCIHIVTPLVISLKFFRCDQSYECWIEIKSLIGEEIRSGLQNAQKILFDTHDSTF